MSLIFVPKCLFKEPDQFMNRQVPAKVPRLCVEKLRNSPLFRARFTLIRAISCRNTLDPELIRGFIIVSVHAATPVISPHVPASNVLAFD
jgi:hypothetical protein